MLNRKSTWPALWLFALLRVPYGVFTGFLRTPFPYLLRTNGVSVDQIANIASFIALPSALYFLWSPIVDFGIRRRSWLVVSALLSAAALFVALIQPSMGESWVINLIFVGFAVNLLSSAASGGLMTTSFSEEMRSRASGWYQAGNLGAGSVAAGLILLMAQTYSKIQVAYFTALLMSLPALSAFLIAEPAAKKISGRLTDEFKHMGREVVATFFAPQNRAGILLVLAPMGSGAAISLFAGMAPDYQVGATQVAWLNGLGGGLLLATGALLGGFFPIRWNRIGAYAVAGISNAGASLFLCFAPVKPEIYLIGFGFYLLTTGMCYARFTALVFSLLGEAGRSASSRYTVLVSLSNLPLVYMTWFEGRGYHLYGVRAVAAIDGAIGLVVAITFLIVVKSKSNRKYQI